MHFEPSRELPQATIVREPTSFTEFVVEGIAQWLRERVQWARPRMIPLLVALAGLGITVQAMKQLSKPPQLSASELRAQTSAAAAGAAYDAYQPTRIRIVLQQ